MKPASNSRWWDCATCENSWYSQYRMWAGIRIAFPVRTSKIPYVRRTAKSKRRTPPAMGKISFPSTWRQAGKNRILIGQLIRWSTITITPQVLQFADTEWVDVNVLCQALDVLRDLSHSSAKLDLCTSDSEHSEIMMLLTANSRHNIISKPKFNMLYSRAILRNWFSQKDSWPLGWKSVQDSGS